MALDYENLMQMMTQGIPHVRELGARAVSYDESGITIAVDQQARFVGDPDTGVIHGGIVTVLLDTVSGMSIYLKMKQFVPMATLDLRIDYLKPARPKSTIFAHAECYRVTRSVAFSRGLAYQDSIDDPIAHCAGSFMLSTAGAPMLQTAPEDDA
jgi:uncharacterized protein (TIGR00369 family)